MNIGEEKKHRFFEPDEYTWVNNRYFADMRRRGNVEIDPSGWIETLSESANIDLPPLRSLPRTRYYMDEGDALGNVRPRLQRLLEVWDGAVFDSECFTACPSVGIASLLTMAVLRRKGAKRIIFETPCYFAAILQAEWLGFEVVLIPTYRRDGYRRPARYERSISKKPAIWWLTHPRATLGFNQEEQALRRLIIGVGVKDYVVIDEALDQSFPSQLGQFGQPDFKSRLIRLKGFGKPLGLNGYRLAFVLHDAELRAEMIDCLETFAGAIDAHSLEVACAVAEEPKYFGAMMNTANQQAKDLRVAAEKISRNSGVAVNPLVNGYLGSAIIDLSALGSQQAVRRHRFLLECKRRRMPVILGPSMHFASDPPTEAVRLNFFSKREHILRCIAHLAEIAGGLFEPGQHDPADSTDTLGANRQLKISSKRR